MNSYLFSNVVQIMKNAAKYSKTTQFCQLVISEAKEDTDDFLIHFLQDKLTFEKFVEKYRLRKLLFIVKLLNTISILRKEQVNR